VLNKEFSDTRRDEVRAVMRAVLEASVWLDDLDNRRRAAPTIGGQAYVGAPADVIEARLLGQYSLGCSYGDTKYEDDYMLYHDGGRVNYPRKAHGIWFMAQYLRFGYLSQPPDYAAVADRLILQDLYREVAQEMSVPIPDDDMKPFTVELDRVTFDAHNPASALNAYRTVGA